MRALQLIYSFFLGLVVIGFVWIGLDTFYPRPDYPETNFDQPLDPSVQAAYRVAMEHWSLVTSIVLLILATMILLIAVLGARGMAVLSNGLLLGGVFTMLYAVGQSVSSDQSIARFVVIGLALLVTIGVGWLKFVRGSENESAGLVSPATVPAGSAEASPVEEGIAARVQALEKQMEALRRAFSSEAD